MDDSEKKQSLALAEHYFRSNNYQFAEHILNTIIKIDPNNSKANELLAYIYGNSGAQESAHNFLIKACKSNDASYEALYYLGTSLLRSKNFKEAEIILIKSLEKFGDYFEGLHDLGTTYSHLGEKDAALVCYKKALKLKNNSPEANFNIGKIYNDIEQHQQALEYYDKAIEIKPNYAEAWANKAITLHDLKRFDEALIAYDKAIELNPNDKDSFWHKAITKLTMGDFEEGWELYENRWETENPIPYRHNQIKRLNSITNLNNKKILIWHEQGFGDTIQFSRYIPNLLKLGAKVTFEVQQPLLTLFKNQFDCEICSEISNNEYYDFQSPLLSLPKLFGSNTFNIPLKKFLKFNEIKVHEWRNKLNLPSKKINIGVAISGNVTHTNNHNRSMELKNMAELTEIANIYLIQKEISTANKKYLETHPEIIFLGDVINDFSDSASIICSMDLIVSVDTSLIHLAGALGKKSFLMLPWSSEWRWLLDRDDSVWYESIKIFRQEVPGEWSSVISSIKYEIMNNL